MNVLHPLPVSVKCQVLLVLVATLGSGVRGHPCPKGQIAHQDVGEIKCCLPVYCDPDHHVQYCKENGTSDTCSSCGEDHWLLKRTSSFNPEQCLRRRLSPETCEQVPGPVVASKEENGSCHCDLENGYFYMPPEISIIPLSNCQPFAKVCKKGQQPTVSGDCEPCPENTFQDLHDFRLCRHQRNCTALGLATEEAGSASKEAVCAKPPPPPIVTTTGPGTTTTTRPPSTKTTTIRTAGGDAGIGTVRPVLSGGDGTDPYVIVIPLVVVVVLLIVLGGFLFFARRKGWIRGIACLDSENPQCHARDYPMTSADNDNTSDNSCCACADSCIASSSKSNGACGKSGASASGDVKQPLPMLEGYMNMNGKGGKESPGDGSMCEPFYSSIPPGGKMGNGDASYVNGGIRPTMLRQEDFYNYPNKVRIPTSDDDDDENNAVNKERQAKRQQAAGKRKEEDEAFTETDPLLPNAENASSGAPTPDVAYPLRGILRNGNNNNNRQEPRGRGGGRGGGAGGGGAVGNRPNLSMLLSEEPSYSSGEGGNVDNLPHLSQLVSRSTRSDPSSLREEPPEQHVHELPQQLAQHLQQQQQQQQQQQLQQEAPTLAARLPPTVPVTSAAQLRLNPATQPHLNPSLVQMEELKPVMPLNPASPVTTPTPPAPPTGAAYVTDNKGRSGSPARIDPTKQEEVRGRDPVAKKTVDPAGKAPTTTTTTTASKVGGREKERDEQTYRKQALPSSSPESHDDEETAHKSVGGSSGLGESLDASLLSDEGRRSRGNYRRSQSEVSRSVSPSQPLPRSISSPEEKHRPFAVVKPMQSDQSLNSSNDQLPAIAQQQLDNTRSNYPLNSLHPQFTRRQVSQDSSDDPDLTRPKTPDRLSEDENEENETGDNDAQDGGDDRTRTRFYGNNDSEPTEDSEEGSGGKDKPTDGGSEG